MPLAAENNQAGTRGDSAEPSVRWQVLKMVLFTLPRSLSLGNGSKRPELMIRTGGLALFSDRWHPKSE